MNQAQQSEKLQNQVDDAAQKVELLHSEVEFSQSIIETLEKIRGLRQVLERGQRAVQLESLGEAVDLLLIAERDLKTLPASQITKVAGLLSASVTGFRHDLVEQLTRCWKDFFQTDLTTATFSVRHRTQRRQLAKVGTPCANYYYKAL